jgi:hypothetical protein
MIISFSHCIISIYDIKGLELGLRLDLGSDRYNYDNLLSVHQKFRYI